MHRWHLKILNFLAVILYCTANSSTKIQSSSNSINHNASCYLPECRRCDILDVENCTCNKVYLACAVGFQLSEDGCNCEISNSTSPYCPNLVCPSGKNINEARCECTDKICETFVPCPLDHVLDLEDCHCVCMLNPNSCPSYTVFDKKNCRCRNNICNSPAQCPNNTTWDSNLCQCKCTQTKLCAENFIFDAESCECVLDNTTSLSSYYSVESSESTCIPPSCKWCETINYFECSCNSRFVDCFWPLKLSEGGCSCESISTSPKCPEIKCEGETFLDENSCICMDMYCAISQEFLQPCDLNYTRDPHLCDCVCNLHADQCPDSHYFDDISCECKLMTCDPSISCPKNKRLNPETCQCYCEHYTRCFPNYMYNFTTCECQPRITTTTKKLTSTTQTFTSTTSQKSSCSIPDCRWCDFLDLDKCECHKVAIKCAVGFITSEDGCSCIELSRSSSVIAIESSSIQELTSPSCTLPECRWCDFPDYETCQCYKIAIDCLIGYELSEDGCTCIEIPNWNTSSITVSHSDCDLSDCRWCDHADYENCHCYHLYIDCDYPRSILSPDGCSCIDNPDWHDTQSSGEIQLSTIIESPSSSPIEFSSATQSSSLSCDLSNCRWCDHADYNNCICYRKSIQCEYPHYILSADGCTCKENPNWHSTQSQYESSSSISEFSSVSQCSLPECRWCDYIDYENCVCHPLIVDCYWPYQLTSDGCSCETIPDWNSSVPSNIPPTTKEPCTISNCRWCDIFDQEKCECYRATIDCPSGFKLSQDMCDCVEVSNCTDIVCPSGTSLNVQNCNCEEISCDSPPSCPPNFALDKQICDCRCDLQENQCPPYYYFDTANCICRHPPCDPPGPCPGNTDWNSEICRCECRIKKKCLADYIFNITSCDCELPNSFLSSGSSTDNPTSPITETISSSEYETFPSPCPILPSCKWCDLIDYENCKCLEKIFDCFEGYQVSPDGCGCIKLNYSEKCPEIFCERGTYINEENCTCIKKVCEIIYPCPVNQILDDNTCECHCDLNPDSCPPFHSFDQFNCICRHPPCDPLGPCTGLMSWNSELCRCECNMNQQCPSNSTFDFTVCDCVPNYSLSSASINISSTPPCFIPSCRWCDVMDIENCVCHKTYINCTIGYELSADECSCVRSNSTSIKCPGVFCDKDDYIDEATCKCISFNSSSSTSDSESSTIATSPSNSSSTSCDIPSCRQCDFLDIENCICHEVVVDCFLGYEQSEDGCSCIKSNRTSESCPGVFCEIGTYIDEVHCECINDACKTAPSCPTNLVMDSQTCECFCNINPSSCPNPFNFDYDNCKCRHPPCDPPAPCPEKQSWDPENCKCQCIQTRLCSQNFTFNESTCDCVCDPNLINTECPSGSIFDPQSCECVEEIECYDFNDPLCACECEEILECTGKKEFDLDYCECLCPENSETQCDDGFIMSDETCECVKQ